MGDLGLLEGIPSTNSLLRNIERTVWRFEDSLKYNLRLEFVKTHLEEYLIIENITLGRDIYKIATKVDKNCGEILAIAAFNYFSLFNNVENWFEYYKKNDLEGQKKVVEEIKTICYKLERFNDWLFREKETLKARDDFLGYNIF